MKEQIKNQIKIKQAILSTLTTPIKESIYNRNKKDIERKKKTLEDEIKKLKEQLDNINVL